MTDREHTPGTNPGIDPSLAALHSRPASKLDWDDPADEQPTTELERAHLKRMLTSASSAKSGRVGKTRFVAEPASTRGGGFGSDSRGARPAIVLDELGAAIRGSSGSGSGRAFEDDEAPRLDELGAAMRGQLPRSAPYEAQGRHRGVSSLLDELGEAMLADGTSDDEEEQSEPLDELGDALRAEGMGREPPRLDELGETLRANRARYEATSRLDELGAAMRATAGAGAGRTSYEAVARLDELGTVKVVDPRRVAYETPLDELGAAIRGDDASARLDELGAAMRAITGLSSGHVAVDQLGVSVRPQPPVENPAPRSNDAAPSRRSSVPPSPAPAPRSSSSAHITSARISFTPSSPKASLPAGITSAIAPSAASRASSTPVVSGNTATARVPLPAPPLAATPPKPVRRGDESREFVRERVRRDTPEFTPEKRAALQKLAPPPMQQVPSIPPLPLARDAAPSVSPKPLDAPPFIDLAANLPVISAPSVPPPLPFKRNVVPLAAEAAKLAVPPAAGEGEADVVAPEPTEFIRTDSWSLEAELVQTRTAREERSFTAVTTRVFATVRGLRIDWGTSVWRESLTRVQRGVVALLPRTTKRRVWILAGAITVVLSAACTAAFLLTRTPEAVAAVETGPTEAEIQRIMISRTGFMISSYPSGARIHVDGRETGRFTPERVTGLTPGLHSIELKLAGYYDTSLPAVLEEGSTLVLPPVDLRPLPTTDGEASAP